MLVCCTCTVGVPWPPVNGLLTYAAVSRPPCRTGSGCSCTAEPELKCLRPVQGVANRDLKLENLLLDHDGQDGTRPLLKISDFGYSKVRCALCFCQRTHRKRLQQQPCKSS